MRTNAGFCPAFGVGGSAGAAAEILIVLDIAPTGGVLANLTHIFSIRNSILLKV